MLHNEAFDQHHLFLDTNIYLRNQRASLADQKNILECPKKYLLGHSPCNKQLTATAAHLRLAREHEVLRVEERLLDRLAAAQRAAVAQQHHLVVRI